jgi:pimeloyl-ACP methyl ester carboxylesterase
MRLILWSSIILGILIFLAVAVPFRLLLINMTPARTGQGMPTPGDLGLAFETLDLVALDGVPIRAWLIHGDSGAPAVVMVHGKDGSKAGLLPLAAAVHRATGYHVLLPDLRGHGESGDAPMTFGAKEAWDVEIAIEALKRRDGIDSTRIGFYGQSMGAAAIVLGAGRRQGTQCLVIDAGFDSLDAMMIAIARSRYGLPRRFIGPVRIAYRLLTGFYPKDVAPAPVLSGLNLPVLVIHSTDDTSIPYERGLALFEAAIGEKEFVPIRGPHGRLPDPAIEARIIGFLSQKNR